MFREHLHNLWLRMKAVLKRRQLDRDLAEELEFHLAMREQKLIEQGMPPREAHYAARRGFGNAVSLKETTRDQWSFPSLESLLQDVRFGLRQLRRSPGFTTWAIVTLALGIGGTTAIFSVIYGVFFNSFPFADNPPLLCIVARMNGDFEVTSISAPEVLDYEEQNRVFDEMAGASQEYVSVSGTEFPERWDGSYVTANFFGLMGVAPLMGRVITPSDVQPDAPPVAVLNYRIWQSSFGADPKILGRTLTLNGRPATVIGVMPKRFQWEGDKVWLPSALTRGEALNHLAPLEVFGRLRPGLSIQQAEAEISGLSKRFAALYPRDHPAHITFGVMRLDRLWRGFDPPWFMMLGAVGILLLIGCVNVANLLLARSTAREKETAIRAALGASRRRVVFLFLVESLLLALGGAGLGCLLAWSILGPLVSRSREVFIYIPSGMDIGINGPVLLFTLGVAMVSTLIFGLAPALLAARKDLQQPLNSSGRGTGDSRGHIRLRNLLVVSEVVLSLVLLTSASVVMRSFWVRQRVNLGFRTDHLLLTTVDLPEARYKTPQQRIQFELEFLRRVRSLPGVVSAALESPWPPRYFPASIEITGKSSAETRRVEAHWTGDRFFETLGIRMLQGRTFSGVDMAQARKVAVVNQQFVREYLGGARPLGQLITVNGGEGTNLTSTPPQAFELVGVVADTKLDAPIPEGTVHPEIYLPLSVAGLAPVHLFVNTPIPAEIHSRSVRREVAAIDKDLPVLDTTSLQASLDHNWFDKKQRLTTVILTAVASLGLLLASGGVYSVLSYAVSRRTHEIGVRMALGAEATDVRRMVMMAGLRWLAVGIGIGMPLSFALAKIHLSQFWGITPADPLTLVIVCLLLTAVGLAACYFPARRATKVDPMVALRCE